MMRHQYVVMFGKRVVEGQAIERAGLMMQDDDRFAFAGPAYVQLAAGQVVA